MCFSTQPCGHEKHEWDLRPFPPNRGAITKLEVSMSAALSSSVARWDSIPGYDSSLTCLEYRTSLENGRTCEICECVYMPSYKSCPGCADDRAEEEIERPR